MDQHAPPADSTDVHDQVGAAHAVLARAELDWASGQRTTAVLLHAARTVLVLEGVDPHQVLPPLGTQVTVAGAGEPQHGRLAEHGRGGRFLVSIGERAVRHSLRLRVALRGTLRSPALPAPLEVEIVDLTTGGARVRGVELPVGATVALDFTPPGRNDPVTVRALVKHGTHGASKPWIGIAFRLVAMRGGR